MKYTLAFVFNSTMDAVLLLYRNKEPWINMFNGIGGKIEEGETTLEAGIRELEEETGINTKVELSKVEPLVSFIYPSGTELHVFYGIMNKDTNLSKYQNKKVEEGVLKWFSIPIVLSAVDHPLFAGEGNLQYCINYAIKEEEEAEKTYNRRIKDIN